MSMDALRAAVIQEFERLNVEAMNTACSLRPSLQSSTDGIALTVVDHLAMARAFATCAAIVEVEFNKLTRPKDPMKERAKIREVY